MSGEKAMAPHSSTLVWKIQWTEEPGRLQPMGSLRVGHDWATSLWLFTSMHWRRQWQPTPVFLPRESQGRGSLLGFRRWGHTESDTTEVTQQQQQQRTLYIHSTFQYIRVTFPVFRSHMWPVAIILNWIFLASDYGFESYGWESLLHRK